MHDPLRTAQQLRKLRDLYVANARVNPHTFAELVLRDETTNDRVHLAEHHRRMQVLWSRHKFSVLWAHPESGKTNEAVARILWELGRNPRLRVAYISKTTFAAEKVLRVVKQYIQHSPDVQEVFPNLRIDRKRPNHHRQLNVERDSYALRDPSIQVTGLGGNILGSRIDLLVLDDWIDLLIARTDAPRKAALEWFRSNNCFGRLTADGRVCILTNAWHPQDPNEVLVRPPTAGGSGFTEMRMPSLDDAGQPTYPERWPLPRIEETRRIMGPREFARAHMCRPLDDGSRKCLPEWIYNCYARGDGSPVLASLQGWLLDPRASAGEKAVAQAYSDALYRAADERARWGAAVSAARELMEQLDGADGAPIAIIHGVDTAVQQHSAADMSAIVSIALYRNGDKRILRVKSGRWNLVQILREIELAWCYFGGTFIVENVNAQHHIVTALRAGTAVSVLGFTTGASKANPNYGPEGLFAEFYASKWVFPCRRPRDAQNFLAQHYEAVPEIEALVDECLNYDAKAHTGDRLMAMWFAQKYAARLAGAEVRELEAPVPDAPVVREAADVSLVPNAIPVPPRVPRPLPKPQRPENDIRLGR